MTTEPSTTESVDSSSSEATVSTEPASSSSDSDTTTSEPTTTTSAEVTTTDETTSDIPTTTTSAEEQPTVLFADDDAQTFHRGQDRTLLSPFQISMYTSSSQVLTISVNGDIRLGTVPTDPTRDDLPSEYGGNAVFPYWTENAILPNSGQGITYITSGQVPERTLLIDFKVMPDSNIAQDQPDHYTVSFFEQLPQYCQVRYYHTHGTGEDATIGFQGLFALTGQYRQYSYNSPGTVPDRTLMEMGLQDAGTFYTEEDAF
ncbi:hypothetical protein CEP54_014482 [Fusarium duplospermum]|uniref:Uncharacterized protein n=1 Tax=Fusarium duplospermum TaxID=1325734 RepID=A0A428NW03_9HYPO|nr:hypothetical protein CEP54_014482 [Fusarium duplospermum]